MGVLVEIKACWINSKWIKPKQEHAQASKYLRAPWLWGMDEREEIILGRSTGTLVGSGVGQ